MSPDAVIGLLGLITFMLVLAVLLWMVEGKMLIYSIEPCDEDQARLWLYRRGMSEEKTREILAIMFPEEES